MRKLSVVVTVGLLITLYVAANLWQKIGDERAQTLQFQTRINKLGAAPPPAAPPAPASMPAPAPAPSPVAKPTEALPTVAAQRTSPAEQSTAAQIKQVLSNPNSNGLMHTMMLRQYPDLPKELSLSQEQADKLIDVIVQQQTDIAKEELGVLSGEVTDPGAVRATQSKVEDKRRAAEAELTTLLGSKYADWQHYQATAAARLQVSRLQSTLGSGNALSESQSTSLLAAFTDAQGQLNTEHRNEPEMRGSNRQEILGDQIRRLDVTNQRLFDAATPILSLAQQEIYKRTLDQTSTVMRATMRAIGGEVESQGNAH